MGSVWELVADPYHLPRWWPRCVRVEDVHQSGKPGAGRWIKVLTTEKGKVVRADYRCRTAKKPREMVWEQEVEGTPFDRILHESTLELDLAEAGGGTQLTLTARQRLRGFSKLGSTMMRRGTARTLDEALDGVERAFSDPEEGEE